MNRDENDVLAKEIFVFLFNMFKIYMMKKKIV